MRHYQKGMLVSVILKYIIIWYCLSWLSSLTVGYWLVTFNNTIISALLIGWPCARKVWHHGILILSSLYIITKPHPCTQVPGSRAYQGCTLLHLPLHHVLTAKTHLLHHQLDDSLWNISILSSHCSALKVSLKLSSVFSMCLLVSLHSLFVFWWCS